MSSDKQSMPIEVFQPGGDIAVYEEQLKARIRDILDDGTAKNTVKSYRSDIRYIQSWLMASGLPVYPPLSPEIMLRFIVEHFDGLPEHVDAELVAKGLKRKPGPHAISTIDRRVASVASWHKAMSQPNPCSADSVKLLMKKARRAAGRRGWQPVKKQAATADVLEAMVATCGTDAIGVRDRALLQFAFSSGGRRRSEVVSADLERLQKVAGGYLYELGIRKTDQLGTSRKKVPVLGAAGASLEAWLKHLPGISRGPVFRAISKTGRVLDRRLNDRSVAKIVKDRAKAAGYDAAAFSGHSLRSGFMTEGGRQNVNIFMLMDLSDHKSVQIARGYYQSGNVLTNPGASLLDT